LLDVPGGNLLYAAAGAAVWTPSPVSGIGLLARVGEDYPREWLQMFEARGFDVSGIHITPGNLDLRSFRAYIDMVTIESNNPLSHFARLGLPYPKSLLGYQPPLEQTEPQAPAPDAPHPADIPVAYHEARAVHLCPLDHLTHSRLVTAFRQAEVGNVTLDPSPAWMVPALMDQVRNLLHGLAAFLPSETEIRSLFWGRSDDLWEMAEALAGFGCEFIVIKRGRHGQYLYDSSAKKRWEIPAYPARLVDPTGAGDSFCGGFLTDLSQNYDPLRATLCGNISASLTIEGSGAFHALETLPGLAQSRLDSLAGIVRQA
jgi:hypothetical protein